MVLDLIQTLLQIFRVEEYASKFSTPIDQFLYAIFFPTVLLLIIFYLLTSNIFKGHKGLEILLGVSLYVFTVVYPPDTASSLYATFAVLGEFWYAVIIIVGVIWIMLRKIKGGITGSPEGGKAFSLGGSGGGLLKTIKKATIGESLLDPREIAISRKLWADEARLTQDKIAAIEIKIAKAPNEIKKEAQGELTRLEARLAHCRLAIKNNWPYDKGG